jgi:hypothetical protein
MKGFGRALFVAILLLLAGTLNVIYGIAAVGNAHFFAHTQYLFSSLHTWGWVTIVVGIIQLGAAVSLMAGGGFGRVIGSSPPASALSRRCSRLAEPTRGGRWRSSPSACGSCKDCSRTAMTSRRRPRGRWAPDGVDCPVRS